MLNKISYYISDALSPRECEIYRLLLQGLGQKEIALKLNIAICTVNTHLQAIYQKKFVNSQKELMAQRIKELEDVLQEIFNLAGKNEFNRTTDRT